MTTTLVLKFGLNKQLTPESIFPRGQTVMYMYISVIIYMHNCRMLRFMGGNWQEEYNIELEVKITFPVEYLKTTAYIKEAKQTVGQKWSLRYQR